MTVFEYAARVTEHSFLPQLLAAALGHNGIAGRFLNKRYM